jgi:hypothetical protein
VSRLLTPAEIEALRANEPFVAAPAETFRVSAEAGSAEIAPEVVASLEPGSILRLRAAKPGLVEIVANAVVVGYGRLEEQDGMPVVRVVQLARAGRGMGGTR